MAVEADGDQMIMISADMTNIPSYIMEMAREKFSNLCSDVDTKKIIVFIT